MQNKNFKTNIKSLLLALLFLVGITFTTAQNWSDPTSNPATNNPPIPITAESDSQSKDGGLVTSGITNILGDIVSYSNLCVGNSNSSNDPCPGSTNYKTPAYFFGPVSFRKLTSGSNVENKICVDPAGKLKVCGSVELKALATSYYTTPNYFEYVGGIPTIKYPTISSKRVVGKVSYKTAGISCTPITNSATTDWISSSTISGTGTKDVTFTKWGTHDLEMNCNDGQTYKVTIKVGGSFRSSQIGKTEEFNFDFGGSSMAVYVQAVGGSGAGAREYHHKGTNYCIQGADGSASTVTVTSSASNAKPVVIANVGPGTAGVAGRGSNCSPHVGYGGTVKTSALSGTGSQSNSGYSGGYGSQNYYGGCSGQPDINGKTNTCHSGGVYKPRTEGYGIGGQTDGQDGWFQGVQDSIGAYHNGGGGGAYLSGYYTFPVSGTLSFFAGQAGGQTINTPKGLYGDGHVWFDW